MFRRTALYLLAVYLAGEATAAAEPAAIECQGIVTDAQNRPVPDVTITSSLGLAVSDADGYYQVPCRTGELLSLIGVGYQELALRASPASARPRLKVSTSSEVIFVKSEAPRETKAIAYELSVETLRRLPGAGNDVLRAAQSLPGVARIPFGFGGLVLRGTSPRDANVYLDGIEVPLAFHFAGLTSFYPSGMLEKLSVMPGGFDASYGNALGGVVELTTRAARRDKFRIGGELGLLHSAINVEGPIWGEGAFIAGVRRSYLDVLARPLVPAEAPLPSYTDAQFLAQWGEAKRRGLLTLSIFGSLDRIANDDFDVNLGFVRAAATYRLVRGPYTFVATPWLGWNGTFASISIPPAEGSTAPAAAIHMARPNYPGGLRTELTRKTAWGFVRGGLQLEGARSRQVRLSSENTDSLESEELDDFLEVNEAAGSNITWGDATGFLETRLVTPDGRFSVRPGLRLTRHGRAQAWTLEPRLNAEQVLAPSLTLTQSLSRVNQSPTVGDIDPRGGNPALSTGHVNQATLGVRAALSKTLALTVTGYWSHGYGLHSYAKHPDASVEQPWVDLLSEGGLSNTLVDLLEKQLAFPTYRSANGRLRSRGIELGLTHKTKRWHNQAYYTLSRAERIDDVSFGAELGTWHPYHLDQPHHLTLLSSVDLGAWRFGARLNVVSGNPMDTEERDAEGIVVKTNKFATRLPTFRSVDIRVDRLWQRPWGTIDFYFDLQNASFQVNPEFRETRADNTYVDVPNVPIVIPSIGVEFIPR